MKLSEARAVLEGIIYMPDESRTEEVRAEALCIDQHIQDWMGQGGDADILPAFDYSDVTESLALWGRHVEAAERLKGCNH